MADYIAAAAKFKLIPNREEGITAAKWAAAMPLEWTRESTQSPRPHLQMPCPEPCALMNAHSL